MEEADPLVRALLLVFVLGGGVVTAWLAWRLVRWMWRRLVRPWEP